MERDFQKELANFQAVWQRVCRGRGKVPGNIKLMPGRDGKKDCRGKGRGYRR